MKRRVLVTGASGGIRSAVARQLARDGFEITLHYRRDRESAEQTAKAIQRAGRRRPHLLAFNVADRNGARHALEEEIRLPAWSS